MNINDNLSIRELTRKETEMVTGGGLFSWIADGVRWFIRTIGGLSFTWSSNSGPGIGGGGGNSTSTNHE